jgi:hypothetical protein
MSRVRSLNRQFVHKRWLGVIVALTGLAVTGCGASAAANRAQSSNRLKIIALAIHNYNDLHRKLPPAAIMKDSKPLLSWRVAILPFMEQDSLYKSFKLDEPWDSPHNLKLSQTVVPDFQNPGVATDKPYLTHYHVFVTPKDVQPISMFPLEGRLTLQGVRDGPGNTIMVIEAGKAVPWAAPDDIAFDPKQAPPELTSLRGDGVILAAFGDTSVHSLRQDMKADNWKALITANGDEAPEPFE